jgi:hypothetical protein
MINAAFAPHDPRTIEHHLSVEECARVLASLKPAFIHRPECKRLLPKIIECVGGHPNEIYFDVPRLRSAYPTTYLTSGIAYAFHPHRDTWYSAPMSQINWRLPIFDISPENCLAFYPKYFSRTIQNNSQIYNYAQWNKKNRVAAAKHVNSDTREQPKPQEEVDPDKIQIICPATGAYPLFRSNLHETVPNTNAIARYSIDLFTTATLSRILAPKTSTHVARGRPWDYVGCSDLANLPEARIALYEDEIRQPRT